MTSTVAIVLSVVIPLFFFTLFVTLAAVYRRYRRLSQTNSSDERSSQTRNLPTDAPPDRAATPSSELPRAIPLQPIYIPGSTQHPSMSTVRTRTGPYAQSTHTDQRPGSSVTILPTIPPDSARSPPRTTPPTTPFSFPPTSPTSPSSPAGQVASDEEDVAGSSVPSARTIDLDASDEFARDLFYLPPPPKRTRQLDEGQIV
ncbi:uncharacterized protein EI90DRAFT_3154819 [Cantharellus anzutake]|uniref:uncharacterized protein n=1 Tax=Cantharellus anzutake TaxID=1750568 RepID=UPI001906A548|nr:uncharacterized protein EI90DRAFT_3154819 [Cantharellus anzutake]KAF8330776.1 hypothetical protein EI90DRAFT_3154819 [Cantharellus anzutake]